MKISEILAEGTWALPDSRAKIDALAKLLSKPTTADAADGVLWTIIGDDDLMDDLANSKNADPKADVRPLIKKRLRELVSGMKTWKKKPSPDVIEDLELLIEL